MSTSEPPSSGRATSRPTQRDVARLAGVSTATVSYVLSGRRGPGRLPTPETAERVARAADELGYAVDHMARSLRRQRSEVLAVVYTPPSSPWSDLLVEQLQTQVADRGETVIALPVSATTPPDTAWRALRRGYVDGAIVLADTPVDATELRALARRGLGLVVVDEDVEPDGFDVVRQGRAAACRAAVEHLVAAGHRRIGYLAQAHETADGPGSLRLRTYLDVMAAHGLPVDAELVRPVADSRSAAYAAVQELLRQLRPPTALFSATDRAAVDGIWAARDAGVRVPDDLAVIGVGNIAEGLMISPPLTTVGAPELDFTPLVQRLVARVDSRETLASETLEMPWTLIRRGSA